MATFYALIPKWLLAAMCAGLIASQGLTWVALQSAKSDHATEVAARAKDKSDRLEADNDLLREMSREVSRLLDLTNQLQAGYAKQVNEIDAAERVAARFSGELRTAKKARDDAIAAADAEGRGGLASDLGGILGACQLEYQALGFAAARCSASIHTLKKAYDSVTDGAPGLPALPELPQLPSLPATQ